MTMMAAEAGDTAVESEASDAAESGRQATGDTQRPRKHRVRNAALAVAMPEERVAAGAITRRRTSRREPQRGFPGGGRASRSNYHGAILAEWLIAFVLVAAIPFSKPNQTGVSPYAGKDMVQLGTLTVVYWILAIVAATGRTQARFAAWFGGLILIAVGLAEASSIANAVSTWFGASATSASTTTTTAAANSSVVNPGNGVS